MKKTIKKLCLIGCMASLTACNSIMQIVENPDEMRYETARVPVEFLLDEGVGKINVDLSYSLKNEVYRDLVSDYGRNYSNDLFGFVVSNMVLDAFNYQDLEAIDDYKDIHEQNFKRHLKKHYQLFDINVCDVQLNNLHKSPKEQDQILRYPIVICDFQKIRM
ncbi:MAG: hypothetical protein IKV03_02845 [Alphaproteobacteria bacterium]|nr:hypothetical protein [Alphaproteobacteria bacterium]